MSESIWDQIEEILEDREIAQRHRDGKCDDERGDFARWLIEQFDKRNIGPLAG